MSEIHLLKDETLGGVLREFVEVDREAVDGDYIICTSIDAQNGKFYRPGDIGKMLYKSGDYPSIGVKFNNDFECYVGIKHYRTLDPTDVVQTHGKRYELVKRKAEVGEKVIITEKGSGWYKGKLGAVFTIINKDDYGFSGNYTYVDRKPSDTCLSFILEEDYRVLVPVESVELIGESSPKVIELLANLARRVTVLESQLADTQRNVERQAEELENKVHQPSSVDNVNSPSHYTHGRFETIEVIEDIVSGYDDPFVAHCVGTATKYLYRAPFKHETPVEDLRKAAKYLAFAIDYLTKEKDGMK